MISGGDNDGEVGSIGSSKLYTVHVDITYELQHLNRTTLYSCGLRLFIRIST